MGMEILRTESLTKVRDGQFAEMIDTKLAAMYQDCVDRPLLKKARKLTIEITIAPTGEDDPLETVDTEFSVKSMTPKSAFSRQMKSSAKNKGFAFSSDTDSANQDENQNTFSEH